MKKKRVLLAHNNVLFVNEVNSFLNQNELYTLSSYAFTGQDLVNKGSLDDYDIVIVKNELTEVSGLYALEELLLKTKERPDYIILYTPFYNHFLMNKCHDLDIYYLRKSEIKIEDLSSILFEFEIKNVVKNQMYFNPQLEVIRLLRQIGLLKTYVGYKYYEYVLNIMLEKSENINKPMKMIYQMIADHFKSSIVSVEKAMRTCVRSSLAKSEGFVAKMLFGYHENDYPSNSIFLQVCIKTLKEQKKFILVNSMNNNIRKI